MAEGALAGIAVWFYAAGILLFWTGENFHFTTSKWLVAVWPASVAWAVLAGIYEGFCDARASAIQRMKGR